MNEDQAVDVVELMFLLSFLLVTLMVLAAVFVVAYLALHGLARLWACLWQPTNPTTQQEDRSDRA